VPINEGEERDGPFTCNAGGRFCIGFRAGRRGGLSESGARTAKDFKLYTGEVMPEVRLHCTTVGDPKGEPILMLHGSAQFGGPGQPLDATKYYVILPDGSG
jgi:homoserine acetyltransferase